MCHFRYRTLATLFLTLLPFSSFAVDADGDGSDSVEEALAGTSDSDPTMRPYWWKTFNGDSANDGFGYTSSNAGDVNNDGYMDIVVGASGDDNNGSNSGSVRALSGINGNVLYTFNGDAVNDGFGSSVSDVGDVNNDGYDDVIATSRVSYTGSYARIFSGINGSIIYNIHTSDTALLGGRAGDVNGDGYADILVSNYNNKIYIHSGYDGTLIRQLNIGGSAVDGAGDVNKDGYDDLVVGYEGDAVNGFNSGSVSIYSGLDGTLLYKNNGDYQDWLGRAVAFVGDINKDGYVDYAGGAIENNNGNGYVRVFSGHDGSVIYQIPAPSGARLFGRSLAPAGDINNDGYDDIIIGAPTSGNKGWVFIYSGYNGRLLVTMPGQKPYDSFGESVGGVGDINNDGYDDIFIGNPSADNNGNNSGSIQICFGWNLLDDIDGDYSLGNFDMDDDGDGMPDSWEIGYGLDSLVPDANLDIDSDGLPNLQEYQFGSNPLLIHTDSDESSDYEEFLAGTDPNNANERPYWWKTFDGDNTDAYFGYSVSSAGDVNNDGYPDYLVGGYQLNNGIGYVGGAKVFSGLNGQILYAFYGDSDSDYFGFSVGGAGDVNNDGYDDVIIGARNDDNNGIDSGSARVFSGLDGTILYSFDGTGGGDLFGFSVDGAGDINNDGYDDVIIGSRNDDNTGNNSGSARIYSGIDGALLYEFNGDADSAYFGYSVSGAGDLNKDGYDDVIVGSDGSGKVIVFSGLNGSALYVFDGNASSAVSMAGDVDGDGYNDILIGRSGSDINGTSSGVIEIFSGKNGSSLHIFAGAEGDELGYSISGAGDINADGYADIIAGASGGHYARVYSGIDGRTLYQFYGQNGLDLFGNAVAGIGDLDKDGYADLIIGAPRDTNVITRAGSARVILIANLLNDLDLDYIINSSDLDDDGDTMPDDYEILYGLNPLLNDASDDLDGDHLSNLLEYQNGFNPSLIDNDFDADAVNDLADNCVGLSNPDQKDTDGDLQGDACDSDDDNDGMPDLWEQVHGLEPLNLNDANLDGDNDGYINLLEYQYGLDPFLNQFIPTVDADNDGSSDGEELMAGTDLDNPDNRPYWYLTFNGDNPGDFFGYSVASAGDVDNDGYDDIIVGAYQDDNNGSNSGSARILSGNDGAVLYTFNGDGAGDLFGYSVAGAGDINNDGYADMIVGAYQDDNNARADSGSARIFSGKDGAILYTFDGDSASDFFGYSVAGAGDIDNDGYADVIVGAYRDDNTASNSGSARIFNGKDGAILYTFNGDSASDSFGYSVAGAGDVNNDGYADVIVGAHQDDNNGSNSGSARIFSGKDGAILYTFNGDSASDSFGYSVAGAGDVNNDGYDDVIVGAYQDDNNGSNSGSARIFSGKEGAILYSFNGDSASDFFGYSVASAGDINADGYDDVIVGAYQDDNNGSNSGSARIFSGIDGAVFYTLNGGGATDFFGSSVAGAGDVDGDGYGDIIVGAYQDDNTGANSGSSRLILSSDMFNDGDLDFWLNPSDAFPSKSAASVDTDGDGFPDNWNLACNLTCQVNSGLVLDNCPLNANPTQLDTDSDGLGDVCDPDDDNDSVADLADRFPLDASRYQSPRHNADTDMDSDVLERSGSTGAWTRHTIQNAVFTGSAAMLISSSSDTVYVAQLDANGDGDADILTRSASTGNWTLHEVQDGAVVGSYPIYLYSNSSYQFVGVGDFNNDGTDDVMLRDAAAGYRTFLLKNHAVESSVFYNAWLSAVSVDQGIGDFDGDGTDDLLVRRNSDNIYFIFKTVNGAVSTYYCACNLWRNPDWTFQFAGDTNKDGIDDIVIRATGPAGDGKWWAFRMANFYSQSYTNLNLYYNKTRVSLGGWGDYNADGMVDVLTRVDGAATYVSPISNGLVTANNWLYGFSVDQVIQK